MRSAKRLRRLVPFVVLSASASQAAITGTGQFSPAIASQTLWSPSVLTVGDTSAGTLTVNGGSDITATGNPSDPYLPAISVGDDTSGVGTLSVSGAGTVVTSNRDAYAGYYGAGTINVSSGGVFQTNGYLFGGRFGATSRGNISVSGSGSMIKAAQNIYINTKQSDTPDEISVTAGGLLQAGGTIAVSGANNALGTMLVTGTGSRVVATGGLNVGDIGGGQLIVEAGGTITGGTLDVGYQSLSKLYVNSGGTLNMARFQAASGALGNVRMEVALGGTALFSNDASFGNAGYCVAGIYGRFETTGAINIGGSSNSYGPTVAVIGANAVFKSTSGRINVGTSNASSTAYLALDLDATAQGQTGIYIDRGGEVNGDGTLIGVGGPISVYGRIKLEADDVINVQSTWGTQFSSTGTLTYKSVIGTNSGKLNAKSNLTLAGTLDLQYGSIALPYQTPVVLISTDSSAYSISGIFSSIPKVKIDADTGWAIVYSNRQVTIQRVTLGDADRNRQVDFADLVALAQNYGKAGRTWAAGDFTGDGKTEFADLVLLAQHYTGSALAADGFGDFSSAWAAAQALAPEPTLTSLAVAGGIVLKRRRRIGNA